MSLSTVSNHRVEVDGVDIFYREAGPKNAPVVLLLHGACTIVSRIQHMS